MKKNDLILLLATALYSGLFYEQMPGINFLIFTVVLLIFQVIRDKEILKKPPWLIAAAGALISALCIAWHGNILSFIANIISLCLVSAFAVNKGSSVIVAILISAFSAISSWYFILLNMVARNFEKADAPVTSVEEQEHEDTHKTEKPEQPKGSNFLVKTMVYGIPACIVFIFFILYRAANPVFDHYASLINLDFISFNWVIFTIGGSFLVYAFFYYREIKAVSHFDSQASGTLKPDQIKPDQAVDKLITVDNENVSGIVLFGLLNAMLLIVNVLDINFLFLGHNLPKGIDHSQMVHQGVDALIWSIIFAIGIILFHFRGRLNFYEKNGFLKALAYIWIMENIFMVFSTGYRNYLYVSADGITAKRIGVYFYLGLCVIGLVFTLLKIAKHRKNWQLVRQVSWAYYSILVISCFINWEAFITDYNYDFEVRHHKNANGGYFISLNTKYLETLIDQRNQFINRDSVNESWQRIDQKMYRFLYLRDITDWRSRNLDDEKVFNEMVRLSANGKILSVYLDGEEYKGKPDVLNPLNPEKISITSGTLDSLPDFSGFKRLTSISLVNTNLKKINGIEKLQHLENLNLSGNPIEDYSPLYQLTNLKNLNIGTVPFDLVQTLKTNLPHTSIVYKEIQLPVEQSPVNN